MALARFLLCCGPQFASATERLPPPDNWPDNVRLLIKPPLASMVSAMGGSQRDGPGGGKGGKGGKSGRRSSGGGSSAAAAPDPDKRLPESQTCTFNLVLPRYSSYAVLVAQLETAMQVKTLDGEG